MHDRLWCRLPLLCSVRARHGLKEARQQEAHDGRQQHSPLLGRVGREPVHHRMRRPEDDPLQRLVGTGHGGVGEGETCRGSLTSHAPSHLTGRRPQHRVPAGPSMEQGQDRLDSLAVVSYLLDIQSGPRESSMRPDCVPAQPFDALVGCVNRRGRLCVCCRNVGDLREDLWGTGRADTASCVDYGPG